MIKYIFEIRRNDTATITELCQLLTIGHVPFEAAVEHICEGHAWSGDGVNIVSISVPTNPNQAIMQERRIKVRVHSMSLAQFIASSSTSVLSSLLNAQVCSLHTHPRTTDSGWTQRVVPYGMMCMLYNWRIMSERMGLSASKRCAIDPFAVEALSMAPILCDVASRASLQGCYTLTEVGLGVELPAQYLDNGSDTTVFAWAVNGQLRWFTTNDEECHNPFLLNHTQNDVTALMFSTGGWVRTWSPRVPHSTDAEIQRMTLAEAYFEATPVYMPGHEPEEDMAAPPSEAVEYIPDADESPGNPMMLVGSLLGTLTRLVRTLPWSHRCKDGHLRWFKYRPEIVGPDAVSEPATVVVETTHGNLIIKNPRACVYQSQLSARLDEIQELVSVNLLPTESSFRAEVIERAISIDQLPPRANHMDNDGRREFVWSNNRGCWKRNPHYRGTPTGVMLSSELLLNETQPVFKHGVQLGAMLAAPSAMNQISYATYTSTVSAYTAFVDPWGKKTSDEQKRTSMYRTPHPFFRDGEAEVDEPKPVKAKRKLPPGIESWLEAPDVGTF